MPLGASTAAKPAALAKADPIASPEAASRQEPANPTNSSPVMAQIGPPRLPPEWGVGKKIWIPALLAVVVIFVLVIRYRDSQTARARKKVRCILTRFEANLEAQRQTARSAQAVVESAVRSYIAEIRRRYLAAITLDEIRKLAPGVRLQPLYAAGVTRLIQCHDWSANRFLQLRGIGPDSAVRIRSACEALTKAAYRQPLPYPNVSDPIAEARELYAKLSVLRRVRILFEGQESALDGALRDLLPRQASVESRTTFWKWLFASETSGPLKGVIEEATLLETELAPEKELGGLIVGAESKLSQAQVAASRPVALDFLDGDVAADQQFYRQNLLALLGLDAVAQSAPAPSRPSPPLQTGATEPISVRTSAADSDGYSIASAPGFRIEVNIDRDVHQNPPRKATQRTADFWVRADDHRNIDGYQVAGMLYVGHGLRSVNGQMVEPALIDPTQPVEHASANCHERMLTYWSNYTFSSAAARASYLQWLERGRDDPAADIGYVFLYFYGLERRALADTADDSVARSEVLTIIDEVQRLRSIYSNGSFQRYSHNFLEYLESGMSMDSGYAPATEPPALERGHVSFDLRRHIGSLAIAGRPLPSKWAYAWFHNDLRSRLPAAAARCPSQVSALFNIEYARRFGAGIALPANKTKLKLTYRPASPSFGTQLVRTVDLPDVTVLSTVYSKLEAVAEDCFRQIDAYSRYIARNNGQESGFDALILLPPVLWADTAKRAMDELKQEVSTAGTTRRMKLRDLLGLLPAGYEFARSKYVALCCALEKLGLGIEPDCRFGGLLPELDDPVAIYSSDGETVKPSGGFGIASLFLQLSSVIAAADGDFSDSKAAKIGEEIEANERIAVAEKRRLLARMMTYRAKAPSLNGLKKTIDTMDATARSGLIDFLITMVQADGVIAPGEVKMTEKIYSLFGLDTAALYSRLHSLESADSNSPLPQKSGVIHLDKAKVERLKAVSAEVTKKLTVIFDAGESAEPEPTPEPEDAPAATEDGTLLGLEPTLAGLLTVLLERSQWTRAEFEELCLDKGLMPDGALESINDAAFTKHDKPIIEGDDPLEVDRQVIEETVS